MLLKLQTGANESLTQGSALIVMQAAVESIVDGLFSALVTLGTVPIIKCPKVGPPAPH